MQSLRRSLWLRAALIAPVLALAVTASSFFASRCTMSGLVTRDGCCPATTEDSATLPASEESPGSSVDAACCESVLVAITKSPATPSENTAVVRLPAVASWLAPWPDYDAPRPFVLRRRLPAARESNGDAPRFLLTHAFLI